jgi:hypothetical protein
MGYSSRVELYTAYLVVTAKLYEEKPWGSQVRESTGRFQLVGALKRFRHGDDVSRLGIVGSARADA